MGVCEGGRLHKPAFLLAFHQNKPEREKPEWPEGLEGTRFICDESTCSVAGGSWMQNVGLPWTRDSGRWAPSRGRLWTELAPAPISGRLVGPNISIYWKVTLEPSSWKALFNCILEEVLEDPSSFTKNLPNVEEGSEGHMTVAPTPKVKVWARAWVDIFIKRFSKKYSVSPFLLIIRDPWETKVNNTFGKPYQV